jgi:hypothetical protein
MAKQPTKPRKAATSSKPKAPSAKPQSKATSAAKPKTKLDAVVAALRAPKGATLAQLMALTGWQMHSVRGALAGALKKKRGLTIVSAKTGKERVYRIGSGK